MTWYGHIAEVLIDLKHNYIQLYLTFDWTKSDLVIKQSGRFLKIPTIAYIPMYYYWKMKRMLANDYSARIIITHDGFSYEQFYTFIKKN